MIHQISEKFKETKEGILKKCMWWTIKRRIQFLRKGHCDISIKKYFWNSLFLTCTYQYTENIMLPWSGICVSFSVFHTSTSSHQFQSGCQESEKPLQILACTFRNKKESRWYKVRVAYPWPATFHAFAKQQHLFHTQETLPDVNSTWDSRNPYTLLVYWLGMAMHDGHALIRILAHICDICAHARIFAVGAFCRTCLAIPNTGT